MVIASFPSANSIYPVHSPKAESTAIGRYISIDAQIILTNRTMAIGIAFYFNKLGWSKKKKKTL